jgi:NAD(P)-dependent dehydrogenase (short-subunit alcohol dehydrogenase family)
MVAIKDVKLNNTSLSSPGSGPTAAFLGGTAGIGLATIQALLRHTSTPKIYIVGRNASKLDSLIESLKPLNAQATIVPIVTGDLTLVSSAQKAAKEIAGQESKLDLLVMSPGFLAFNSAPDYSSEGLDKITAIRYQTRARFLLTLLPLLQAAPNPRVISILAGGQEGVLNLDDLGMTDPKKYGPIYAANASAAMNTLLFEHLTTQKGNEKIVFEHIFPGIVKTDLKLQDSGAILSWVYWFAKIVVGFFAQSMEESGERILFAGTNGRYRRLATEEERERAKGTQIQVGSNGEIGSGVYLVQGNSDVMKGGKALTEMREKGAAAKVYEYTLAEFERIEKM